MTKRKNMRSTQSRVALESVVRLREPITAADIRQRWVDEANALTREKRQEFLDLMWGGATMGEARERLNISFEAAMGILDMNIQHHEAYTMRTEAI